MSINKVCVEAKRPVGSLSDFNHRYLTFKPNSNPHFSLTESCVLLSKWSPLKVWVQSKSPLSLRKCWEPEVWVHNPNTSTITDQAPLEGILRNSGYYKNTILPVFKNRESNKTEAQLNLSIFGQPLHSACVVVRNGSQWIQSAFGLSQWNKSNSDNQAKCLSSASFSHVTTTAKSDFCQ